MLLQVEEPFSFALSVERIAALGPDRVNALEDGRLWRAIDGRAVCARAADGGVALEPAGETERAAFAHVFATGFSLPQFTKSVASEPTLGPITRALAGLRPYLVPEPFEMLVTSIAAQQISLRAALAVRNRFVERYGEALGPVYAFPRAETVAAASQSDLRELGFSRSKAGFVLAIAGSGFDFPALAAHSDDEVVEALTELPGVGRWTAEWFLARHLGREDVWPAGDLGVRRACERFITGGEPVDEASARGLGERFAPQRTLACAYLLAALRRATERSGSGGAGGSR